MENNRPSAASKARVGGGWIAATPAKVAGLTVLFAGILSFNYACLAVGKSILQAPLQLVFVAFIDASVLGYLVVSSRLRGWKAWASVFLLFYGVNYVLTAVEGVYLNFYVTEDVIFGLIVNGAVISGAFATLLVGILGRGPAPAGAPPVRPKMAVGQWAWKIALLGMAYLLLYFTVGLVVYYPIAGLLDPAALAQEQGSLGPTAAALILPTEIVRGSLWALFAIPATISLPFGWKKNALVMGLLFALPMAGSIFLSTAIAPGLELAHSVELFGENMIFGIVLVWILRRGPTPAVLSSGTGR